MKITDPKNVNYLALEGGGGKGVTYLGAIRALESLGILPIDINRTGQNQIRGISGASAGAITGLMLALGIGSVQMDKIMSKSETFTAFFDEPMVGLYRF
jgi:predicted acylesterase/phospholipase RssA